MPNKMIIGFGYKRLRGKDTAANMMRDLLEERGIHARRDAFATTLKTVCQAVFGFTHDQVHTVAGKENVDPFWGFTPRWALQRVGTEAFRRQIQDDVWVKVVERRHLMQLDAVTIISDIRFENEALKVQELDGIVIRVDRGVEEDESQDQHISEIAMDKFVAWDYIVNNDTTLSHLKSQLENIVSELVDEGKL